MPPVADPFQAYRRSSSSASYRKPLPDTETNGLLHKLTGYSSSALQTGLHILDTPGSIARGGIGSLVGAKPQEGQRTSGRDLTDAIGLTGKYDKGWLATGLGIGAEIATDPLTYFTGGAHHALTDSGRALSKIGALKGFSRQGILEGFHGTESALTAAGRSAEDIAHLRNQGGRIATAAQEAHVLQQTGKPLAANQPLGALGGFGLPFASPKILVGQGPTAQRFAGTLDSISDKLKYGTTLGRWGNGLLDYRAREAVGGATQRAAVKYGHPAYEAAKREGRAGTYDLIEALDPAIKAGVDEDSLLRGARQATEGVRLHGVDPAALSAAGRAGTVARGVQDRFLAEAQAHGLPLSDASDLYRQYGHRQGIDLKAAKDLNAGKNPSTRSLLSPQVIDRNNLPVATGSNFHIDPVYRDIPGGTEMLNDLARSHAGSKDSVATVAGTIKGRLLAEAQASGVNLSPTLDASLGAKSAQLARKFKALPEEHVTAGVGLYSPNLVADVARRSEQHARTISSAASVYGFIGDNARPIGRLTSDATPISELLTKLGLTHHEPIGPLMPGVVRAPARVKALEALAKHGARPVGDLANSSKEVRAAIDQFGVTRAHAEELLRSHGRWSTPEVLAEPAGFLKQFTSTFKNFAYPLFPSSHVRNSVSAALNNFTRGSNLGDHSLALRLIRDTATADELRRVIPEIPAGIGDEAARSLAKKQAFVNGKVFDGHSGANDLGNQVAARLQSLTPGRITPDLFGSGRTGGGNFVQDTARLIGHGIRDQAGDAIDYIRGNPLQSPLGSSGLRSPIKNPLGPDGPLRQAGVFGGQVDNPALATGRTVGGNIEDFFRTANYLSGRRNGLSPEMAGDALRALHFDYDQVTKFERNVLRQAVPFYTFARKNLPLQASYLAHTPAAPLAQLRLMNGGRGEGDFVPDYLAGGAAIPIGSETPGHERFISSFGTPLEEALERFKFKNGAPDIAGTARQFLASGNPIIKAPLEQLFDTQLHTGRKLSDLRAQGLSKNIASLWGDENPQVLSQILANTPATRFFSSFDKLTDDRKPAWARAVNLATGVRLTDVDLDRSRSAEAANARNEILRSMPHISQYTNFYPRRGEEGNLNEQEIEMLRLLRTMQERAKSASGKDNSSLQIGFAR